MRRAKEMNRMPAKRQTVKESTLAGEIQRKTAEIDDWPAWARPYEHNPYKRGAAANAVGHDRDYDRGEPRKTARDGR
jgi:hypothetical protein